MRYVKVKEYSERYGISTQKIYKAVKVGRLPSREVKGVLHVDGETDIRLDRQKESNLSGVRKSAAVSTSGVKNAAKLRLDMEAAKLRKVEADRRLQEARLAIQSGETLRSHLTLFYEIFRESFLGLKVAIQKLNLDDQQLEQLSGIIESCVSEMELRTIEALNEAEKNTGQG